MTVLHFPDAVDQHHKWFEKLSAFLHGESVELVDHEVVCDDNCYIGQWIYGDGLAFEALPEFQMVKKRHKDLHQIAAKAWTEKQNGRLTDPEPLLNEIKQAGHDLFMSWNQLNFQIGALD